MRRRDPFPGVGKAEMTARIDDARLSDVDDQIARLSLIKQMDFSDIAAEVHYSRSTVSRRYHDLIKQI